MNFKLVIAVIYAIQLASGQRNYFSPSNLNNSDSHLLRSKRNANDPFSVTVGRARKVSRIVNGIALQQGLTKGSIDTDTLISEFINFQSMKPSDIQVINSDILAELVKGIQDLPNQLKIDDKDKAGIERNENRFLLYEEMLKKTEGINNDFKIEKKDAYTKAVSTFVTTFKDEKVFEKALVGLAACIKDIEELSTLSLDNEHIAWSKLTSFTGSVNSFKNLANFKFLVADQLLRDEQETFKKLRNVHSAVEKFQNSVGLNSINSADDHFVDKIGKSIKILNDLAGKSKSSLSDFQSLNQMFVFRHPRNGNKIQTLTSGFQSPSEIDLIFKDLEDPWIKKAINNTDNSLSAALGPLKTLKSKTEDLENSLILPDGNDLKLLKLFEEVLKLSEYVKQFDLLDIKKAEIDASVRAMAPTNRDKMGEVLKQMEAFSEKLKAIETVINVSTQLADGGANSQDVQEMLKIILGATTDNSLEKLVSLQKSDKFRNVLEVLKSAKSSLTALYSGNPPKPNLLQVKTLAEGVKADIGAIDIYKNGLATFFDKMDELRKVQGINVIGEAVTAIQFFRKLKPSDLKFDLIASSLKTANSALNDLRKTIGDLKGESNNLSQLKDVLRETQTVGSATKMVSNMETAVNNQIVIEQKSIDLVKKELDNVKDPADQKNLNVLTGSLNGELNKLYQEINTFKSPFKAPTASDLSSIQPIFMDAKKIPGLSYDFGAIRKSLKNVPNLPQQDVEAISKQLEKLESFGLDFAKRHGAVDESKKALAEFDLLFVSYSKQIAAQKTGQNTPGSPGVPSPQGSNAASGALGDETTESPNFFRDNLVLILAVTIPTFICMILIVVGLCCWVKKKDREKKKVEPIPKPDDDSDSDADGAKNKKKDEARAAEEAKATPVKSDPSPAPPPPPPAEPPAVPPAQNPPPDVVDPKDRELQLEKTQKSLRIELILITPKQMRAFLTKLNSLLKTAKSDYNWKSKKIGEILVRYLKQIWTQDNKTSLSVASNSLKEMRKWQRHPISFAEKNRVTLRDPRKYGSVHIHGNLLQYPSGLRMIMMQGPQAAFEDKECNIEMAYAMFQEQGVEKIVQLTKFKEIDPKTKEENEKVSEYIPLAKGDVKEFRQLKVTCTESVKMFDNELEIRDLLVEFEGQAPFSVQHLLYNGWPDHGAPDRTDIVIGLLRMIRENPYPVVVHCSAGIGRTGAFAMVELISQRVSLDSTFHYGSALSELRQTRANAIQEEVQYVFAFRCAVHYMAAEIDLNHLDAETKNKLLKLTSEMDEAVGNEKKQATQSVAGSEAGPSNVAEPKPDGEKKSEGTKGGKKKEKKKKSKEPSV